MKIAVSSMGTSLDAWTGAPFGICPQFVVVDTETQDVLVVAVPAAVSALVEDPRLSIVLVGDQPAVETELTSALQAVSGSSGASREGLADRVRIQHAESVIDMDAKPAAVLRRGRGSSLWTECT